MDTTVARLAQETDFVGYVIVDWDSYFGMTTCPNSAVAMCLERFRTGGEELGQFIKCYSIGTLGEYSETPGKRVVEEYDWNRALRQLMG
jgi:hypothetical protein